MGHLGNGCWSDALLKVTSPAGVRRVLKDDGVWIAWFKGRTFDEIKIPTPFMLI